MRTLSLVLPVFLAAALHAQAPHVTPAPPFSSMSRVPVSDFASDIANAPNRQERPAIATDGTNLMAVWADARYGNYDVFASRLDAAGSPIDKLGIPVAPTYPDDFDPSIAWNGTDYGIVWATQYGVLFSRISRDGVVSSQRKLFDAFVAEPRGLSATAMSWNGTEYLVAFSYKEPNTSGATLMGMLVAADGTLRSDSFAISRTLIGATNPSIATDGTNFLVTWEEAAPRQVVSALVSPEGAVSALKAIGNPPPTVPYYTNWTTKAAPKASFNGSTYAVVWTDTVIRAQRISLTGELFGAPIAISNPEHYAITPSIAALNSGWVVAFADSPTIPVADTGESKYEDRSSFDIATRWVAADFASADEISTIPTEGAQYQTAVSPTPLGAVVLWTDERAGFGDVMIARLSKRGQPTGASDTLTYSISNQQPLGIATSGDVVLVVWKKQIGDGSWGSYWRRFRSDGAAIDSGPSVISWGDPVGWPVDPDSVTVAASDDGFLLTFTDLRTHELVAMRITRNGDVLDPWGLPLGPVVAPLTRPSAASDGHDFLIGWATRSGHPDWLGRDLEEIHAIALTASGMSGPEIVITPSQEYLHQYNPVAIWTGDAYLVAWSTFYQGVYPYTGISARYVGSQGTPSGDTFVIESPRHYGEDVTTLAFDGERVAVGADLFGYVADTRVVSDAFLIPGPYIVWDGTRFVGADVPIASFGNGRNVAIGSELIRMLPASHAGGVNRVYVGFFNSLRTRAVRRN